MAKKMGLGIIGAGYIGARHASTMAELDCADLVAVADIDSKTSETVAKKFGADSYTDYKDLLKRDDVEAVVICTPQYFHLEPARDAAEAGKHILLEKPIAHEPGAGQEIIDITRKAGVRLMIAHVMRYGPRNVKIQQTIEDGEIGDVVHMFFRHNCPEWEARRLKGRCSVVFYLGVHDIDFMRWCFGDVEYVYAEGKKQILKDIDTWDSVFSMLKFKNGTLGVIENQWINPLSFDRYVDVNIMIAGTKGLFESTREKGLVLWGETGYSVLHPGMKSGKPVSGFAIQDEHFIKNILSDEKFRTTGEDALAAVKVCTAIHESVETGKKISL